MIAPHLVKRPDLDPLKVLAPVAPTGKVSLYLVTLPKFPASDVKAFLAYDTKEGKVNFEFEPRAAKVPAKKAAAKKAAA